MKLDSADTIVAISTPPGENGIGIVRLSGPDSLAIAQRIFLSKSGRRLSEFRSHTIHYGHVVDGERRIDEVLISVMRAPKTYTTEDMVEINCHGGIVVLKQVLELAVSRGARVAQPGEFTKRAFLNGRIDLAQAEAVLDIITSRTGDSLRIAQRQLDGELSRRIKDIRSGLLEVMADIEADINFPDEELGAITPQRLRQPLEDIRDRLLEMFESSDKGLILREGVTTVICGKPNVGKSSLMNSFLKYNRMIVTPLPGTTRDAVEEFVNVRGIPLRIVDTAGIIHSETDEVAKEGIERSRRYLEIADLILLVLDSNDRLNEHDIAIIDSVRDKKVLVVVNKTDLPEVLQIDEIKARLRDRKIIRVSAKHSTGLEELKDAIYDIFWSGDISSDSIMLSNIRHREALKRSIGYIDRALKGIEEARQPEFISLDLRDAVEALDTITGEVFTDQLLETIFGRFCIGK